MRKPIGAVILAMAAVALAAQSARAAKPEIITPAKEVAWQDDIAVPKPLINRRGKAFRGLEVFVDVRRGNCVACHSNTDVKAMQFLGAIGPDLDGVGGRYSRAELRAIVVDAHRVFGDETIMPAFYVHRWGARTPERLQGKTILTAQEVEDLVAYLLELQR